MPLINPEEAIRNSFKILSRRRRSPRRNQHHSPPADNNHHEAAESARAEHAHPGTPGSHETEVKDVPPNVNVEEFLLLNPTEASTSKRVESDFSTASTIAERKTAIGPDNANDPSVLDLEEDNVTVDPRAEEGAAEADSKKEISKRQRVKRKYIGDRRLHTWLPCTCPQYKVTHELASKWDAQAIFFGKVMAVKVVQLLFINIVIFGSGYNRDSTYQFFKGGHDWAYLAFGLFSAYLLCIRVLISYRARWPKFAAYLCLIPPTLMISFIGASITVIYNSILIPFITCSVLLTFILLCFAPYLLRKSVMNRAVNFTGAVIGLLSSIVLLFLKEMEVKPITYWDFLTHVWLPGLILEEIVIMITIFEIQRVIFGLCFNVSTKRWHVAALYI